jgi:hypothetical protein
MAVRGWSGIVTSCMTNDFRRLDLPAKSPFFLAGWRGAVMNSIIIAIPRQNPTPPPSRSGREGRTGRSSFDRLVTQGFRALACILAWHTATVTSACVSSRNAIHFCRERKAARQCAAAFRSGFCLFISESVTSWQRHFPSSASCGQACS